MAYVYKIINKTTKQFYLGRCNGGYTYNKLFLLKTDINSYHCSEKLKPDIEKFGRDNFEIEILIDSDDMNALSEIYNKEYNKTYYNNKKISAHFKIVEGKIPYVFKIINTITNDYYVGICNGNKFPKKVLNEMININSNEKLKSSVYIHGRENFRIEIIIETTDLDELYTIYEMELSNSTLKGSAASFIKLPKSESTKQKMSDAKKGSVYSQEIQDRRSDGQRARFAKLKELGLKVQYPIVNEYLIYYNGWHHFKNTAKETISEKIGFRIDYAIKLAGDKINTGQSISPKLKHKNTIIYDNSELISQLLPSLELK